MDRLVRVELEAALRLLEHHRKHVVAVLRVALHGDDEAPGERARSGLADGDLRAGERVVSGAQSLSREREGARRTLGSRSAVHRLSSRSGTFS